MASPVPAPVKRALAQLGEDLSTWRKLRKLTSAQVADRAGVSRSTLVNLENGRGGTLENTLRVARALGVMDSIASSLDPYSTDVGRFRADEALPQRVRNQ